MEYVTAQFPWDALMVGGSEASGEGGVLFISGRFVSPLIYMLSRLHF